MKVGDGTNFRVWKVPWLLDEVNGYVTTDPNGHYEEMKVSDLIKPDWKEWNENKVEGIFNERDWQLILSIPLSENMRKDGWMWLGDTTGIYLEKSGYKVIHNVNEQQMQQE